MKLFRKKAKTPSKKPYKFFSFGHRASTWHDGSSAMRVFSAHKGEAKLQELCVAEHCISKYEEVITSVAKEHLILLVTNNLSIQQWFLLYGPQCSKFAKMVLDAYMDKENFCLTFKFNTTEKDHVKYFRPKATGITRVSFAYYNYKLGKFTYTEEVFERI